MGKDHLQEIKTGHLWEKYLKGALEEAQQGKYRIPEVRASIMIGLDVNISKIERLIQEETTQGRDSSYWKKRQQEDMQRKLDLIMGREITFSNGRIKIPRA